MWDKLSNQGGSVGSGGKSPPLFVPVASKVNGLFYRHSFSDGTANNQNVTYRIRHQANTDFSFPQVVYGNWMCKQDEYHECDDMEIGASIEYGGQLFPLTFNGQYRAVLKPGQTVISDPVALGIPVDAVFYTRTNVVVEAGKKYLLGMDRSDGLGEGMGQGDLTLDGSIPTNSGGSYHPILIIGKPLNPAVAKSTALFVGDSITAGASGVDDYNGNGFPQVAGRMWKRGVVIAGRSGENVWQLNHRRATHKRAELGHIGSATHAIFEYGTNDLEHQNAGYDIEILKGNLLTLWTFFAQMGYRVCAMTIPPRVSDPSGQFLPDSQTPVSGAFGFGSDSVRARVNDWIRSLPAPLVHVYDFADWMETSRNSGLWKQGFTGDGVHPNGVAVTYMAERIDLTKLP